MPVLPHLIGNTTAFRSPFGRGPSYPIGNGPSHGSASTKSLRQSPNMPRSSTGSSADSARGLVEYASQDFAPARPVSPSILNSSIGKGRIQSQYPRGSGDSGEFRHVEYILVASFDTDRGPVMEQQYPESIDDDGNMLAELMLPDQTHTRSQDWTVFFLHNDIRPSEELSSSQSRPSSISTTGISDADTMTESLDQTGCDGSPSLYVINLVNTREDTSAERYVYIFDFRIQGPSFC